MKGDFKILGLGKCKDCVLMNWDGGFSGEQIWSWGEEDWKFSPE